MSNLRYAARQLSRRPAQAVFAVLALGLGIGLTTAMSSVLQGVFGDLPFDDADRIMSVGRAKPAAGEPSLDVSVHDYLDWRAEQGSFEDLVAYYRGTITTSGYEFPRRWRGGFVSTNFFRELGVAPALGSVFGEDEAQPNAEPRLIIAHDVWVNHFGGDESVIGRSLRINNRPGTIIGVMPEGFRFPFDEQAWLPLWSRLDPARLARGEGSFLEVFGRLKEGVTVAEARAEFSLLSARLAREFPTSNEGVEARIARYTDQLRTTDLARQFLPMTIAVWAVYLIACLNVANLLLSSSVARRSEIAVRFAIGADTARVLKLFAAQAFLCAVGGAAIGFYLTRLALELFQRTFAGSQLPHWVGVRLSGTSLVVALVGLVGAAVVGSVLPAWAASRGNPADVLRGESGRGRHGAGWLSRALIVAEVALSFALVALAGLLVASVLEATRMDHSFPTRDVLTARIALFESKYADPDARAVFFEKLERRLTDLPGVTAAAITLSLPGSSFTLYERFGVEGESYASVEERPSTHRVLVSSGFFETFAARPLEGRTFGPGDRGRPVIVVNEAFAARRFPDRNPIGREVRFDLPGAGVVARRAHPSRWRSYTIVGVVPNLRIEGVKPEAGAPDGVYHEVSAFPMPFMSLAARVRGTPVSQATAMRSVVAALDPDLPLYQIKTLDRVIDDDLATNRLLGRLFIAFGLVSLFLSMTGLYGVVSIWVGRRHREVALRAALGARPVTTTAWVLKKGGVLVGAGVVLGLGIAVPAVLAIGGFVEGVSVAGRGQSFLVALILTAATGFAACFLPALRATQINIVDALRRG